MSMTEEEIKQGFKQFTKAVQDEKPATARDILSPIIKDRIKDAIDVMIRPEVTSKFDT